MSRKVSKNQLNDGMYLDVHPSGQRPTTTRKTKNFRVITRDNNIFILSKIKGTKQEGQLNTNYVPLAIDDINGVAYIISAEVIDGEATGRGEIGCFPSPDYNAGAQGALINAYQPLKNFGGDLGEHPGLNGSFRSSRFNFSLDKQLDIELQNDYDGTVNIIFTDGKNPIRIINSGFVTLPGDRFQIIDRSGTRDSNRYTASNFDNTIKLEARSTKIMNIEFLGAEPGGQVPTGTIQYLFAYETADGNQTEIVAQSMGVPVFNGDRVFELDGGVNTGDLSDKLVRFKLKHLDQSYASVVVYVIVSQGMLSQVRTAYRINQQYGITGEEMDFVHTGFEDLLRVSTSDIIAESSTIDTAETLAQADGHLVIGNIREKTYDVERIRKFFRLVRLGHKQITMDIMGPESGFSRLYNEPLNQSEIKSGTDAYNGGYANPKNVHDRLGYWGGEAYPFMGRLILPDGSNTPLFPVVGVDNLTNNRLGDVEALTESQVSAFDATNGFSTDGKMLNSKGIYRFPNRDQGAQGKLFYMQGGEGRITVNGITFKIPELNTDLGDGVTIKDIAIGIQFFRGERRDDVLMQGTMIDAIMVPQIDYDHANTNERLWDYSNQQYTEGNSKLIPAFGHILETANVWDGYGSGGNWVRSGSDRVRNGIEAFWLNNFNRNPWQKLDAVNYLSPFAMISTDLIVNPSAFYGVSARQTRTKLLNRVTHRTRVRTTAAGQQESMATHFSVFAVEELLNVTGQKSFPSKAAFTPDTVDVKNALGFTSVARFQGRRNNSDWWYLFRNKYNAYMGLRLDGNIRASDPNPVNAESGEFLSNMLDTAHTKSYLANVYNGADQRTAEATAQVYNNIDNIRYFPISGRMYFDSSVDGADPENTLEGRLDSERKITLFGGDCFITHAFRRLYQNLELSDAEFTNKNEVVRTGYTISVINEGNYNASIRSQETRDAQEGVRRHPTAYATPASPVGTEIGLRNSWRDYLLFESAGFNKGYNMTDGNITYVGLPLNVPFTQSYWRTRVWASSKHVPNSFENGYRRFFERNYRDYPSEYGQITKLLVNNGRLFSIHEGAIGTIVMNEKIQVADASGGAVSMATGAVLSDLQILSKEIGSRHKSSIVSTDDAVYGVMLDRGLIWAAQVGSPVARISDFSIKSFLDEQYTRRGSEQVGSLLHNVVSAWNKGYGEVLFTFYTRDGDGFNTDRNFTVAYSEISKKIFGFMGFVPMRYMNIGERLYSFSVADPNRIYLHDSDEVNYAFIYGQQQQALLSVVLNPESSDKKEFQNLLIESNRNKPDTITYRVEGARTSQELRYVANDIVNNNCKYKSDRWEITIPKVTTVHHQDAEQKIPQEKAARRSISSVGSRLKGKFCIAEITYNDGNSTEISSVSVIFKAIV